MKKIVEIKKTQNQFYMYWTLTDFCNFKCHYCPSHLHDGAFARGVKQGFPTNDEINTFIDRLIQRHLRGRELYMVISGGEPTLHPMFETIIERLAPYGFIGVNTNASRPFEWWSNLKVLPQQVTISLHPEYSKIDKVNDLARFLLGKQVELQFNVSCDPKHWSETLALYQLLGDDLKIYAVPKVLNHLESTRENYDYTPEQRQWINDKQNYYNNNSHRRPPKLASAVANLIFEDGTSKKLTNISELTINNQHDFKGWLCSAGDTSVNAHFDGEVWASICKITALGRLESFELLDAPVTCTKNYCTCPGDIMLNKRRP